MSCPRCKNDGEAFKKFCGKCGLRQKAASDLDGGQSMETFVSEKLDKYAAFFDPPQRKVKTKRKSSFAARASSVPNPKLPPLGKTAYVDKQAVLLREYLEATNAAVAEEAYQTIDRLRTQSIEFPNVKAELLSSDARHSHHVTSTKSVSAVMRAAQSSLGTMAEQWTSVGKIDLDAAPSRRKKGVDVRHVDEYLGGFETVGHQYEMKMRWDRRPPDGDPVYGNDTLAKRPHNESWFWGTSLDPDDDMSGDEGDGDYGIYDVFDADEDVDAVENQDGNSSSREVTRGSSRLLTAGTDITTDSQDSELELEAKSETGMERRVSTVKSTTTTSIPLGRRLNTPSRRGPDRQPNDKEVYFWGSMAHLADHDHGTFDTNPNEGLTTGEAAFESVTSLPKTGVSNVIGNTDISGGTTTTASHVSKTSSPAGTEGNSMATMYEGAAVPVPPRLGEASQSLPALKNIVDHGSETTSEDGSVIPMKVYGSWISYVEEEPKPGGSMSGSKKGRSVATSTATVEPPVIRSPGAEHLLNTLPGASRVYTEVGDQFLSSIATDEAMLRSMAPPNGGNPPGPSDMSRHYTAAAKRLQQATQVALTDVDYRKEPIKDAGAVRRYHYIMRELQAAIAQAEGAEVSARASYELFQRIWAQKRTDAAAHTAEILKVAVGTHQRLDEEYTKLKHEFEARQAATNLELKSKSKSSKEMDKLKAEAEAELAAIGFDLETAQAGEAQLLMQFREKEVTAQRTIRHWRPIHAKLLHKARRDVRRMEYMAKTTAIRVIQRAAIYWFNLRPQRRPGSREESHHYHSHKFGLHKHMGDIVISATEAQQKKKEEAEITKKIEKQKRLQSMLAQSQGI